MNNFIKAKDKYLKYSKTKKKFVKKIIYPRKNVL